MANVFTLTTPLLRQTVGFDRFNDVFETLLRDDANNSFDNYPPYNIEKHGQDQYQITMAVAGFGMDDLDIVLEDGELSVTGKIADKADVSEVQYLHRGIATRGFNRTFRLADYIQVRDASLTNGLLTIQLEREVPEEKKPRQIAINGSAKQLEG